MKYVALFVSLIVITPVFANAPGHWQCIAIDAKENNYSATGLSIEAAMKTATQNCKKASPQPKSCKSAQSFCEQGPLSVNGEHCLVTDDDGHAWDLDGKDACRNALLMCNRFLALEGGPRGQCWVKHGSD
jgi:hypothetical protein